MFGFMNFNMRNFSKNNAAIINGALDKIHKGELQVSEILDSDELVNDVKSSMSQTSSFFNEQKNIKDLLDYVLIEPSEDDHRKGHKFPFLACEILCSENPVLLKNIFDESKPGEEEEEDDEEKTKKKSEYDDIDLEFDDNLGGQKTYEDHILKGEEDVPTYDNKFNIEENEDGKNKIEDIFNKEADNENEKPKEDEDMVNIDIDKDEIKVEVEESPFEKQEEENKPGEGNNRYESNEDEAEKKSEDTENAQLNKEEEAIETQVDGKAIIENPFTDNIVEEKEKEKSEENDGAEESTRLIPEKKEEDNKKEEDAEDEEIEEKIEPEEKEEKEKEEVSIKERKESVITNDKFDTAMLDYFFNFLNTETPLNFVLSGYFAKVFGHFLNQRQGVVMKYILVTKPEILKNFTKHLNRKSIVECMYKILISYSDDIPKSLDIKISFLKMIIDGFNPEDEEIVTNICDLIIDLFSVRKMYILFITNKNIFQMIFDFVLSNINNDSFKHLIKILIKTNENILKDFGSNIVTPTFTFNETQELFFNFTYNVNNLISGINNYNSQEAAEEAISPQNLSQQLLLIFNTLTQATQVILKNFVEYDKADNPYELETTFGVTVKMLGTKRLLEIEYIRTILEILINTYASAHLFTETLDLDIIIDKIIESGFLISALVSQFFNFIIYNLRKMCFYMNSTVSSKKNLKTL